MVVYMFGFGFPTLLFFGMKFMGLTRLSLPDVHLFLKVDNLFIWLFLQLLHCDLSLVYHTSRNNSMALDGLWND
jgi:hypothetical protein